MTFVSRLLESSYHGNSCRGNKGQMKGSNLAFADAEIGETPIAACVKIQPGYRLIVFGLGSIKRITKTYSVLQSFFLFGFFFYDLN